MSVGVVGLAGGRAVGLPGVVVDLSGRVVDLAGVLFGGVDGLAGRGGALSGCSFGFFSLSAAGELIGPASRANTIPAASQRDIDFK